MNDAVRTRALFRSLASLSAVALGCQRAPEPAVSAQSAQSTAAHRTPDASQRTDVAATDATALVSTPALPTDVADLVLASEVSAQPAARSDEATRAARELITWVRPCLGSISAGATMRATVAFESNAFVRATLSIASDEPRATIAPIEACAQQAASALTVGTRALRGSTEFSATYRVLRKPAMALDDPARRCERDQDCRLTTGTCTGPAPVHYLHATMRGSINARALATRQCPQSNVTPSQPRCERGLCVASASSEPQWRTCARTQDCVTLMGATGAVGDFTAVNRASVARASQLWPTARVARAADRPPVVSCEQGFCALGWVAPDPNAIIPRPMR